MNSHRIPQGFEPHFRKSPFTDPWEPLYSKRTEKAVIMGLRLAKPHTNARGLIHGGLIAALADNAMGYSCLQAIGWNLSLVTISLSVDFTSSAEIGQWLSVESDVIRTGGTLCFAQCLIKADDVVIARANGTFRVMKKHGEGEANAGAAAMPHNLTNSDKSGQSASKQDRCPRSTSADGWGVRG